MRDSKILFLATMLCVFTTASAQLQSSRHSHYETPEVINGLIEPERLPPGVKERYVLTSRLSDLKEELSEEDFALVSAGVEEIKAAQERRNAEEVEWFEFICRHLANLDIETILQIIEKPHFDMMNLSASEARWHISGLSDHGQETLRNMIATTDYHILIVHPNNSEYARKHPDFFRARVSDKCQSYLSQIDETSR